MLSPDQGSQELREDVGKLLHLNAIKIGRGSRGKMKVMNSDGKMDLCLLVSHPELHLHICVCDAQQSELKQRKDTPKIRQLCDQHTTCFKSLCGRLK